MNKSVWIVLGAIGLLVVALLAVPMLFPSSFRPMYDYGNGGMMGPWMMGGFGIAGAMLAVLCLVILVAGIVWLLQSVRMPGAPARPSTSESGQEILNRRYAAGEITKKQYQEMKRDLSL